MSSNYFPAAPGWNVAYLVGAGSVLLRPVVGFEIESGSPVVYAEGQSVWSYANQLPGFVGIVGPGQDARSALREQLATSQKKLPPATPPTRDEIVGYAVGFDDRGRFRHP